MNDVQTIATLADRAKVERAAFLQEAAGVVSLLAVDLISGVAPEAVTVQPR